MEKRIDSMMNMFIASKTVEGSASALSVIKKIYLPPSQESKLYRKDQFASLGDGAVKQNDRE